MTKQGGINHINVTVPEQCDFMLDVVKMFSNAGKKKEDQVPKKEQVGAILFHYTLYWLKKNGYLEAAIRSYEIQNHKIFDHELYDGFRLMVENEVVEDDDTEKAPKKGKADTEVEDILGGIEAEKA